MIIIYIICIYAMFDHSPIFTTSQDDLQQHGSPRLQRSLQRAVAGPGASLLRRQRLRRRGDLRGGELEISLEPPGIKRKVGHNKVGPWPFIVDFPMKNGDCP